MEKQMKHVDPFNLGALRQKKRKRGTFQRPLRSDGSAGALQIALKEMVQILLGPTIKIRCSRGPFYHWA